MGLLGAGAGRRERSVRDEGEGEGEDDGSVTLVGGSAVGDGRGLGRGDERGGASGRRWLPSESTGIWDYENACCEAANVNDRT